MAPKHKGLSILIVDTSLPGVSIVKTDTLGDNLVCTTYYDRVRVPVSMRVGEARNLWS